MNVDIIIEVDRLPLKVNPETSTQKTKPSTLNPQLSTPNPQPSTRNPQPSTPNKVVRQLLGDNADVNLTLWVVLNPKPFTPHPKSKPKTLNPKP